MKHLKQTCSFVAFLLACGSVVDYHAHDHLMPTLAAIGLYCLATIFMLFKGLEYAKIDLDDQTLELDSKQNPKE